MEKTGIKYCRFYENKFPKKDDLVMIKNKEVSEVCTIAELLEYGNIEGMITSNEYTRPGRSNNFRRVNKINKKEIAIVLAVDEENGYIDLSTKKVDKKSKEVDDRYKKGTKIYSLIYSIHDFFVKNKKLEIDMEELYEKLVYPFQKDQLLYDFILDNFENIENIYEKVDLDKIIIEKFILEIKRRFAPKENKIRAKFELKNHALEGVENIRKAMKKGEELSEKDIKIEVRIEASPTYYIVCNSTNKKRAIDLIEKSLGLIENEIKSTNGFYSLKEKPKVIGNDEQDLEAVIEDFEDEYSEEDEDEGMRVDDLDVGEI